AYHLENSLKAKELYRRDQEYLIREGEILIVDEFTGRVMAGRRYSEGLHQAIEAKEGVEVKRESQTVATITLQNYFRLYKYLSGMTGTALTEAEEFAKIYNLDTVVIPTNREVVRKDMPDVVFRTQEGKFRNIIKDIMEHNKKGQPVLVGTTSVEKSEVLSEILSKEGVEHRVLNAKQHEMEAQVVSMAGQRGAVTIATNMAGRGTDIALGEGVRELGGLYVIGSERHDARRIDNQLRGRSGRQGDPGESRFYVSFEDELMRLFGGENMKTIMGTVGMSDDMPVSLGILGRSIETAQKRVEAHNYDIRKNLVEYDDVLNQQREIVYNLRRKILALTDRSDFKFSKAKFDSKELAKIDIVNLLYDLDSFSLLDKQTWDIAQLEKFPHFKHPLLLWILKKIVDDVRFTLSSQLADDMKIDALEERTSIMHIKSIVTDELIDLVVKALGYKDQVSFFRELDSIKDLAPKEDMLLKLVVTSFVFHVYTLSAQGSFEVFKVLVLEGIRTFWMQHLDTMTDLREGISLRNFAQKNPLVEYKNEGFALFDNMIASIDTNLVNRVFKVRVIREERDIPVEAIHEEAQSLLEKQLDKRPGEVGKQTTVKKGIQKVGRNDPCPCGSGKKYKKCHYPLYG
ncbi:SEC-C domain-containing protein, partial [bacterium]|nr:SEC-C domain-containing protein [bacterium]